MTQLIYLFKSKYKINKIWVKYFRIIIRLISTPYKIGQFNTFDKS